MKLTDDFDARCLRSRPVSQWKTRLALSLSFLLIITGVLMILAAITVMSGYSLFANASNTTEYLIILLAGGSLSFVIGILFRHYCRRRLHNSGKLTLSPELMKKRVTPNKP